MLFDIEAHPFLCFSALSSTKAMFKDKFGKLWCVEVEGLDMKEVAGRGLQYDALSYVENNVIVGKDTQFVYSIMKNRLDNRVKRGAVVKAIAISSR